MWRTVNRDWCVSIMSCTTLMIAALSSIRAELSTLNSFSELFCLCSRFGPNMVARFRDVILLPITYSTVQASLTALSSVNVWVCDGPPKPPYRDFYCAFKSFCPDMWSAWCLMEKSGTNNVHGRKKAFLFHFIQTY